jgi:hypothetical protein
MKNIILKFCAIGIFLLSGVENHLLVAQSKSFQLKELWSVPVGKSNFRTTINFDGQYIYFPSNGENREDISDSADGFYILDAKGKNGPGIQHVNQSDANGIAISESYIITTSDDGFVRCYNKSMTFSDQPQLVWQTEFAGEESNYNLEGAPVLADITGDGIKDVIVNVEGLGLAALNGAQGEILWRFYYEWGEGAYMNSPAAWDLNQDGVTDFIIGAKRDINENIRWDYYQNSVFGINGKNGKPIWQFVVNSNIHASPVVVQSSNETFIAVAESYSLVSLLNTNGKLDRYHVLNEPGGGISGLFSTPVFHPSGYMVIGTSWWGADDGVWAVPYTTDKVSSEEGYIGKSDEYFLTDKVSASAAIVELVKSSKGEEFIIPTEKGELLIISSLGKLLHRVKLPAGTECTPLIADVNGDKKLEIVIADYDGNLRCYATKAKVSSFHTEGFRGGSDNNGIQFLKK